MKIELNKEILVKKLATVLSVINEGHALPVLGSALFEFKDSRIHITGSDLELTIKTSMEYDLVDGEEINFVIEPSVLMKTIQTLKDDMVWIKFLPTEKMVYFGTKSTRKKYQVPSQVNAKDFPLPKSEETVESIEISGANISKAVSVCARFTNKADLRPAFTGVNLRSKDGKLQMFGTNANVISMFEFDSLQDFSETIIPRNIAKVVMEFKDSVTVTISKGKTGSALFLSDGNISVSISLVDAKFLEFDKIFAQVNMDVTVVFPRIEVLEAIKRSSGFQNATSKTVVLDFTSNENQMSVKAENTDFNKASTEEIEYVSKEDFFNYRTGFNSDFISSILSILEGDNIVFSQIDYKTTAVLRDDKDKGYKSLFALGPLQILGNNN